VRDLESGRVGLGVAEEQLRLDSGRKMLPAERAQQREPRLILEEWLGCIPCHLFRPFDLSSSSVHNDVTYATEYGNNESVIMM